MRKLLFAAILLAVSLPARAAWDVRNFLDPMTDKAHAVASVTSGPAVFRVSCVNGKPFSSIAFAQPIYFDEIGVNYRFDNGPVVSKIAPNSSGTGRELWLYFNAKQIRTAKRLRVQVMLEQPLFLDFDLTGADAAVGQVRCG